MDATQLTEEGHYGVFGTAGARTEMPGCSLCMGNQAQVREGATVMSTSTRNFPNRLGKNTNVYLGSAELAAICSKLGRIPTKEEYMVDMGVINKSGDQIYQYLNFDKIADYKDVADVVELCAALQAFGPGPGPGAIQGLFHAARRAPAGDRARSVTQGMGRRLRL